MRLRAGCAWIMIVTLLLTSTAHARPSVGRAGGAGGGGGGRPAAARPQMPTPRPQAMPQARPQMPNNGIQRPAARPGSNGPGNVGAGGLGGMSRPQTPTFQRPSVGSMQTPNPARPSLPNAMARPQPSSPLPGGLSRPGLGAMRPGAGALPSNAGLPGTGGRPGPPLTKPAPQPGLPGLGGGNASRPGGGFANRPGLGPTTKPSFPKPGLPGGGGGGLAGGNRPTTLPGTIGGNRPEGGGNRPGLGNVNRPTTLPGDLGSGNRPGVSNRPTDLNRPGRPGIGGDRPGIGNGNWNSGNFNGNNFNNINVGGGGWGYGGSGYGGWGYGGGYGGFNHGWVNPHYGNWYNGGWNGGWGGYNGGWWAPFAAGAATWGVLSTIGSWGLGYGSLGYGAAGYVNPYYASMPATVVASSPYDYSQPIVVNNYIPSDAAVDGSAEAPAETTAAATPSRGDAAVDDALTKFKAGDYAAALAGFDQALKLSPKDSVVHEVRALALFALGRYPEAAAALNAVLASAPGMDWTTISNVYGSVDAYTTHLRRLEDACRSKPDDAAAHFVLAYHYLVGGHSDMAAAALRVVVAKQPGDVVAKRMLEAIDAGSGKDDSASAASADAPAQKTDAEATAEQPLPEIDLVGTWKATSGTDTIELIIAADSTFTWKAQPEDKPTVDLKGTIETAADAIALVSKSAGTMVAKVAAKGPDAFEFSLPSAPKDTKPLLFARQP